MESVIDDVVRTQDLLSELCLDIANHTEPGLVRTRLVLKAMELHDKLPEMVSCGNGLRMAMQDFIADVKREIDHDGQSELVVARIEEKCLTMLGYVWLLENSIVQKDNNGSKEDSI